MRHSRLRRREVDRDIAITQHLTGIPGGGETEPADPGQLAEILAERAASRLDGAARQIASLGRRDVGDQHAAHAAAAPDHPDSGSGHGMPPSPAPTALPRHGKNTSGAV
jgi:hypothetical protein